jgi:hypothetical protein
MSNKVYIYLITNKINGHRYIGQTVNLRARWSQHSRETSTSVIGKAINKYGKDNFKLEVLEETVASLSNDREVYWIKHFNTYENKEDYNCHVGGDVQYGKYNPMFGLKGVSCPTSKVNIKVAYKIRADYIANKKESIYTLSDRYNLSTTVISEIVRGTHWAVKGEPDVMRGLSGEDRAILSKNMCLTVYNIYKAGKTSVKKIATKFGICGTTVLKICKGNHWSTEGLPDLVGKTHTSAKITKAMGEELLEFYKNNGQNVQETYDTYKNTYPISYRTTQRICFRKHWSTKEES